MVMVYRVRMPDGVAGRTDGTDIWIDDRMNEVQEKCAVAHELEHIRRGHGTLQPEAVEMSVRYEVAKRLLPLEKIAGVCKQDRSLAMIAKDLEVTRQVLMDRAATLTDNQALAAGCLSCLKCPSIQARYGAPVTPRTQRKKMLAA
jgi:Zn-dependent peptidase ImmA (M78 family)